MYEGTIIENSLADKSILGELKIEKTYRSGSWTLHEVLINENQISKVQNSLDDGPWYIDARESGSSNIIVIFKDKKFVIKNGDEDIWSEAIEYGKSIGIPEEQLDFPIK